MKFKDYTNKDCCLNCDGFCFWDGDYCCTKLMEIHQYGIRSNDSFIAQPWMNQDIDNTMLLKEECKDYNKVVYNQNTDNEYIKEYKKWKEWDRLCKQYENNLSVKNLY